MIIDRNTKVKIKVIKGFYLKDIIAIGKIGGEEMGKHDEVNDFEEDLLNIYLLQAQHNMRVKGADAY
jgi:hypothetical protein